MNKQEDIPMKHFEELNSLILPKPPGKITGTTIHFHCDVGDRQLSVWFFQVHVEAIVEKPCT